MLDGRVRVALEHVTPEIDAGRYPIKRVVDEQVVVEADAFADGHDTLRCVLRYRHESQPDWSETSMTLLRNDRWQGAFSVTELGTYSYTVVGWVDAFLSWQQDFRKRVDAAQDLSLALRIGANLLLEASGSARGADAKALVSWSKRLIDDGVLVVTRSALALSDDLTSVMERYPDRAHAVTYPHELSVRVDQSLAGFSAWYELFPRSTSTKAGRSGTFVDCIARLPYIAEMGFDVLYMPPIHPIGVTHRKGKNNAVTSTPDDPGSPWAIGSELGGHKAINPELGKLADFKKLLKAAKGYGLEIALDIAFQCSPDHPYVKEHPEWFRRRPDGTVQFAENPPKQYQDIYPFNFECNEWKELWTELKSVFMYWIGQGVRVFRVDNPHTKPFAFWEWVIAEVKREHPNTIFLAEAFTRPKIMYHLAKLGFTQSYTYFAWKRTAPELISYLMELTQSDVREYFHPNFWPNTPDILTDTLQEGGRPAFLSRLILAATLSPSYGIYGPAFELVVNEAREYGSEEYLASEKYEVKHWKLDAPGSLSGDIARINRIRREHEALHRNSGLVFHPTDNEQLLCFSKQSPDKTDTLIIVVNLDYSYTQSGWVNLNLGALGFADDASLIVSDVLNDAQYTWKGRRNFVRLDPRVTAAHVFSVALAPTAPVVQSSAAARRISTKALA